LQIAGAKYSPAHRLHAFTRMGAFESEWIVADQRGAFAMGTLEGVRTRKYHGFFMGVAGRTETAYLADLEIVCNGIALWPHFYAGPEGAVYFPDPSEQGVKGQAKILEDGSPHWKWRLPGGVLSFSVRALAPGGIRLEFQWQAPKSRTPKNATLRIRGFFAMRNLHALGGETWEWHFSSSGEKERALVVCPNGTEVYQYLRGNWNWLPEPQWNQNFHYLKEAERGYAANENLYSAGQLEVLLAPGEVCDWSMALDENDLGSTYNYIPPRVVTRLEDFVLTRPAGIVAGFPWFGEWGRDTFVTLPGLVGAVLKDNGEGTSFGSIGGLESWIYEILHRWGSWIDRSGMLPNLIEKDGECQWQSCDATLWWCHSLASLWAYSLCPPYPFAELRLDFSGLLSRAIASIRESRHLFLKESPEGLLEVTAPHTSWMDAQVKGVPVTPRTGFLPEINALWFEARCLHGLWSENGTGTEVKNLGNRVLQCQERGRPNRIFMHSLPLAPSFVLQSHALAEQELTELAEKFWTPVGLRTLDPHDLQFRARCVGDPEQRDLSYHQGPAWGWLGGQFEIARDRLRGRSKESKHTMFTRENLEDLPIEGHIPELFDAEPPFTPRGAPAQAWSLGCLEEAKARRRMRVDSKISKVLAQRWIGRGERQRRKPDEVGLL